MALGNFHVGGGLWQILSDGADENTDLDYVGLAGLTMTFTSNIPITKTVAVEGGLLIVPQRTVVVQSDGTFKERLPSGEMAATAGIDLLANDPELELEDDGQVQWTVTSNSILVGSQMVKLQPWTFDAPAPGWEGTIDELAPVLSVSVTQIIKGDSAYQVAVNNGFSGSQSEWLASLRGTGLDLKDFGPAGDGATDDRAVFVAADTAAQAAGLVIMVRPGTYRIDSNLTITSPVTLAPGARIKPASGVEVAFSGGITTDGLYQVFDQSLGGTCVPLRVAYLHPGWWGPTGAADDSAVWNAMLTACAAKSQPVGGYTQQRILVPAGENRLWQVTIRNFHVQGNGRSSRILPPATATAGDPTGADTGYMVRLRSTTTVDGVDFDTNGIGGIVAVFYTGSEGHMTNSRVLVSGENSIGVWCWVATGSITPKLTNVSVEGTIGEPFGVGIRMSSYDFELTNCWIYYCTDGIQMTPGGSGVISGSHIWGCTNAGIYADYVYGVRLTNCYIENNEGWGAYFNAPSHLVIDNTTTFWKNGLSVPNTGGMRLSTNGAALSVGNRIDATFDDNYGTGLWLDWAKRTTGDIRVVSSRVSVQGHSDPLGTDGVYIGSNARDTDIRVRASFAAPVTGLVVNNQSGESAAIDQVSPVASTQMGGTGATNGANTWAKLATFTSAATFTNFIGMYAFTVNYAGTGECGILSVRLRNNATGADPSGGVQVLAMGGFIDPSVTKLTPESFKLINGALGEPFELWVQKSADYLDVKLRELTASDQGQWQVAYPRLSAWQSTTPTGTVGNRTSSLVQAPQSTTSTVSSGSGSVLILTIASTRVQVFTGSTSHRVRLPSGGVKAGMQYTIVNQSTGGTLAVESSDGTTVTTLTGAATPTANILVALRDAPTTNTHWRAV